MYSYVVIIIPRGRQIQLMIRTRMDLKFVTMIVDITCNIVAFGVFEAAVVPAAGFACDRVAGSSQQTALMSNDQKVKDQDVSQTFESSAPAPAPQSGHESSNGQTANHGEPDRLELLGRARSFLASPQVAHQDLSIKRKFLTEKGLRDAEIDVLLRETVSLLSLRCNDNLFSL